MISRKKVSLFFILGTSFWSNPALVRLRFLMKINNNVMNFMNQKSTRANITRSGDINFSKEKRKKEIWRTTVENMEKNGRKIEKNLENNGQKVGRETAEVCSLQELFGCSRFPTSTCDCRTRFSTWGFSTTAARSFCT